MQDPGGPQIQDDEICYLCDTQTPSDESPFPRVASCSLCRAGRRGVDRTFRTASPRHVSFSFSGFATLARGGVPAVAGGVRAADIT